eukprot:scaffold56953_cov18-Prasinocladus_malaysianus.AAC.2
MFVALEVAIVWMGSCKQQLAIDHSIDEISYDSMHPCMSPAQWLNKTYHRRCTMRHSRHCPGAQ